MNPRKIVPSGKFKKSFNYFFLKSEELCEYHRVQNKLSKGYKISYRYGLKYVKITYTYENFKTKMSWGFVSIENGNIYRRKSKSAFFSEIKGNIFEEKTMMENVMPLGIISSFRKEKIKEVIKKRDILNRTINVFNYYGKKEEIL